MEKYFYKLKNEFQSREAIWDYVSNYTGEWDKSLGNYEKTQDEECVGAIKLPISLIKDECLLKIIQEFKAVPIIWRLPKNTWYIWHRDYKSQARINISLSMGDAHTIFGVQQEDKVNYRDLKELVYEPSGMYAFNPQEHHCVFNLNDVPRLLFSIPLMQPYSYADLMKFVKDNDF